MPFPPQLIRSREKKSCGGLPDAFVVSVLLVMCSMQGEGHERIINRQDRRHHSALAYAIAAG